MDWTVKGIEPYIGWGEMTLFMNKDVVKTVVARKSRTQRHTLTHLHIHTHTCSHMHTHTHSALSFMTIGWGYNRWCLCKLYAFSIKGLQAEAGVGVV